MASTQFENFLNVELPRRPALLTLEITGYDGDPNSLLAPDILKRAPKGTFFLRNADAVLWRKQTPTWNSWADVGGGGTDSQQFFEANCLATDVPGDFVRVSAPDMGEGATVTAVDIRDSAKMPTLGILVSKSSDTVCTVQRYGRFDMASLGVTNLIAGKRYFVGLDSRILLGIPSAETSPSGYVMVQPIGVAVGPSVIDLRPDLWMVKSKSSLYFEPGGSAAPPAIASALASQNPFVCPTESEVGDLVYLESEDSVGLALAAAEGTMPCFGIIQAKVDSAHCYVQLAGEIDGLTGLAPAANYYVSAIAPGKFSTAIPVDAGHVVQKIGSARNSAALMLAIDTADYIVLS